MNDKITVWTKQNKKILQDLEKNGRYIADINYIKKDMENTASIMLEVYNWLSANIPIANIRPKDADYLVWVSLEKDATMSVDGSSVILELEIDKDIMSKININKWTKIVNYSYIPKDKKDEKAHMELMNMYGVSDAKAYMSQFYPQLKVEIIDSWKRLFDSDISLGNDMSYGVIWEIKKEWIKKIYQ